MDKPAFDLDSIRVASPCSASWAEMDGDARARFCRACRLHVYDLSAMTRPEAEELLREKEGRACVRFFRRKDGTVLTQDCPVGLAAARRRLAVACAAAAAVVAGWLGWRDPFAPRASDAPAFGAAGRGRALPTMGFVSASTMGEIALPAKKRGR